jgi:hypothetical protein
MPFLSNPGGMTLTANRNGYQMMPQGGQMPQIGGGMRPRMFGRGWGQPQQQWGAWGQPQQSPWMRSPQDMQRFMADLGASIASGGQAPPQPYSRGRQPGPLTAPADLYRFLTGVLGGPPRAAGTSVNPNEVYGESNPNSRAAARADAQRFMQALGRPPTWEEQRAIEQRHLGWGY